MSFSKDIEAFVFSSLEEAANVREAAAIELFSGIITDTPVDTGRLRGNWQLSLDSPANGTLKREVRNRNKSLTQAERSRVENPRLYENPNRVIYLTNNLEYAGYIEYGTAKIAPRRMVKLNVDRVKKNVAKLAALQAKKK